MKLITCNNATASAIETQVNKQGGWRARLVIEYKEKPLEGWTGFVYSTEQEAIERIKRYAAEFRPHVRLV